MHDQEDRSAVRNSSLQPKGIHDRLRLRESFFRGGFQEIWEHTGSLEQSVPRSRAFRIVSDIRRPTSIKPTKSALGVGTARIEQYAVPDIGE